MRVRRGVPGSDGRREAAPEADGSFARRLALAQAGYYTATGVWSLVHYRSFTAITGPKADEWLVHAVGGLVTATGIAIGLAARRRRLTPEIALLAAGSATGLGLIDAYYAMKGRISGVYLLDALIEAGIVAGWAASNRSKAKR